MLTVLSANSQAGGYRIANSLRFRSSASAYLSRTPAVAGNQQKWTMSFWMKRGAISAYVAPFGIGLAGNSNFYMRFEADNTLFIDETISSITQIYLITTQVFRDPSAWYHMVLAVDTTQATASNRIKLYVNGSQVTSFSSATYPSQNYNTLVNSTNVTWLGTGSNNATPNYYFDGYLADINFIDGQALTPSSFGEFNPTTGVWIPKQYSGTYGTNGFYLKFTDTTSTTTLCYDYSGNSNNWTPNNISLTAGSTYDSMLDSPTNYDNGGTGVGNYCVMNAVSIGSDCTLSDGNLGVAYGSSGTIKSTMATIGMSSGKWYCEFSITGGSSPSPAIGVSSKASASDMPEYIGYTANGWGYYIDGTKRNNAAGGGVSAYGATWTTGDIIGIAFDADAGSLTFYKNGASQGVAFTGLTSGPYYFGVGDGGGVPTFTSWFNFGQRPFAYTPPTGYKALNTQNLPAPSIQNGASYVAATLYTGTGAAQNISNAVNSVSFKPDLLWIKCRSVGLSHVIQDAVRGANLYLNSNTTNAEGNAASNGVTSFNSNGFSLGPDTTAWNQSGATFVGWQWKAGGTAVTNTAGSITSSVSANTTSGFSVVTYTGNLSSNGTATVGHGLGVAPSLIIAKARSATSSWVVHHVSLTTPSYVLLLDSTGAQFDTSGNGTVVAPTSNVFTTNYVTGYNVNGVTQVAYCFAAIQGYSAFGSYTGNGSADGPFIYTGFLPRWILTKPISGVGNWRLFDTARSPYNASQSELFPDLSGAEIISSQYSTDILSNGFKPRSATTGTNDSGVVYVYACFAENPFTNALAR